MPYLMMADLDSRKKEAVLNKPNLQDLYSFIGRIIKINIYLVNAQRHNVT